MRTHMRIHVRIQNRKLSAKLLGHLFVRKDVQFLSRAIFQGLSRFCLKDVLTVKAKRSSGGNWLHFFVLSPASQ